MNHAIKVSFVNVSGVERVKADPNPLPLRATPPAPQTVVSPGDTVTWVFDPATVGGRELQVVFQKFGDFSLDPTLFKPSNPLGPLSSISLGAGVIVGTIRSDVPKDIISSRRFFYNLVENGIPLDWANGVDGAVTLGGGIDIPRTPP